MMFLMSDDFEIKLTEEELDSILKCFESDRNRITEQFGFDADADMQLQLFKTFKQQILENQEIMNKVRERKHYHLMCEGKFDSGSTMAQFHHAMWEELSNIEGAVD